MHTATRLGPRGRRARSERGVVLPGAVALLGASGVFAAGAVFVMTEPAGPDQAPRPTAAAPRATTEAAEAAEVTEDPLATETTGYRVVEGERLRKKKPPAIVRSEVYLEVYNNSGIVGLADRTASRAQAVGWNVVAVDNWYGTITGPTVYYPEPLRREAALLATDLGIDRVVPAVAPMSFDRLTVILTAGYS